MAGWKTGRGMFAPLAPLIGEWASDPAEQETQRPLPCTRSFRAFGKGWIQFDAVWRMGEQGSYRETAFFGPADKTLAFFSFTNDGKRSEGRLADAADVHADAVAFEAQMPAGLARMIYWPLDDGAPGFQFAVESRMQKGWNRFLRQIYRPA
jgi:hypothetical protein